MRITMLYRSGRKTGLAFILILAFCNLTFAQKNGIFSKQKLLSQYATIGVGAGTSHYFGDLAPYTYFYYGLYTNVRWNGSINYTRFLTTNAAARVSFTYARIAGDDHTYSNRNFEKLFNNYLRNLHFRNDIKEFTISGLFNLVPQEGKGAKGRSSVVPYFAIGLGFYGHNPQARLRPTLNSSGVLEESGWVSLKPYSTAGQGIPGYKKPYSLIQPVMPIGFGVRVKINEKFDFTAEASLRITPFDYLDDVGSDAYVDPAVLLSNLGPAAAGLAYRADENKTSNGLKDRLPSFLNIISRLDPTVSTTGMSPADNAADYYGFGVGSKRGGQSPLDVYIVTQFTISYILSNSIKCPPIK